MSLVEEFAANLTDRLLNERSPEKAVDIVSFETENVGKWKGALIMIRPLYSLNIPAFFHLLFLLCFFEQKWQLCGDLQRISRRTCCFLKRQNQTGKGRHRFGWLRSCLTNIKVLTCSSSFCFNSVLYSNSFFIFIFFYFSGSVIVKISMVFFKDLADLLPKRAVGIKK